MNDPDETVRNNSMWALVIFTEAAPSRYRPAVRVPYPPFVAFLNSSVWTDRNKSAYALDKLSKGRDRQLLTVLARDATPSLVEMARWKSNDHAEDAFMILGRLAGLS